VRKDAEVEREAVLPGIRSGNAVEVGAELRDVREVKRVSMRIDVADERDVEESREMTK